MIGAFIGRGDAVENMVSILNQGHSDLGALQGETENT
jgi:hypothetical protein